MLLQGMTAVTDKAAHRAIFVAWEKRHADLYGKVCETAPCDYFPLNQKAADAFQQAGWTSAFPAFWNMVEDDLLVSIDAEADRFSAGWRLPPYDVDHLRAWIWMREAAYIRHIVLRLEQTLGGARQWIVPHRASMHGLSWHGAELAPMAAFDQLAEERPKDILWTGDVVEPVNVRNPPDHLRYVAGNYPRGHFTLLSAFGIPDILTHLERLVRGGKRNILLLLDRNESGPLPLIYEWAEQHRDCVALAGPFDRPDGDATGGFDTPDAAGPIGHWVSRTRQADIAELRQCLEPLYASGAIGTCILSDHDCPQTVVLTELAAMTKVPVQVVPHGARPMAAQYFVQSEPRPGWSYFAATRRARHELAKRLGKVATIRAGWVSPRYQITLRRVVRTLLKVFRPSGTGIDIGIAVTSGEAMAAPNVSLQKIGDHLRAVLQVPPDLAGRVRFHIRLRETEDRAAILKSFIGAVDADIGWEASGGRTPVEFLRNMDLVVEVGLPGSIFYESCAEMVAFAHIDEPGATRSGLLSSENYPIRLRPSAPWETLRPLVSHAWRRKVSALKGWLFLLVETRRP